MSFLSRLRAIVKAAGPWPGVTLGGPGAETYSYSLAWQKGLPLPGGGMLEQPYAQHPAVARAIGSIGEDAASVEWEIFSKDDEDKEEPLKDHPLLTLWQHPNPAMSGIDLWIATYTSFKLWGEIFWYYPDVTLGTTKALAASARSAGSLVLLDPKIVEIHADKAGLHYRIRTQTGYVDIDPRYLTHFKRFNPYNPLRGLSELEALLIEIQGDYNAAKWNENFFGEQAGIPAGLAKPPANQVVDKDMQSEFKKRWNESHAGRRAFGILPPGWEYQDVGSAAKDMDFRALREYAREQTFGTLGLPPFLAGVLDKANYANSREQKDVYWHNTITRLLTYFQEKLNTDFIPKMGLTGVAAYPRWETVRALTDNLQEKATVAATLFALGFSKRMLNERLELGFDMTEIEDPDVGYIPFNLSPAGEAGLAKTAAGPVDPNAPPVDPNAPTNGAPPKATRALDAREMRRTAVWRAVSNNTLDLEHRFSRMMRSHYNGLEREVMGNLIEGVKGWLLTEKVLKAEDSGLFDKAASKRRLMAASEPLYRFSIMRGAEAVIAELDLGIAFDPASPEVMGKLSLLTGKLTRVDDTIERQLRDQLGEGVSLGESAGELAKRIETVFDAGRARAFMIARTETGQAFSWGRFTEMSDAGIKRQEWISARDTKVREDHVAEDGEIVPIGEPFPTTKLLYPLDSAGPPEQIINCRCVAVPVLEGEG